jgi:hypothetical protein
MLCEPPLMTMTDAAAVAESYDNHIRMCTQRRESASVAAACA